MASKNGGIEKGTTKKEVARLWLSRVRDAQSEEGPGCGTVW